MYNMDEQQMLGAPPPVSRQVSHGSSSHYESPPLSLKYTQQLPPSRKRSRTEDVSLDYAGLQQLEAQASQSGVEVPFQLTPHGQHAQPQAGPYSYQLGGQQTSHHSLSPQSQTAQHVFQQPQQSFHHHHHHLPDQPPPAKMARVESEEPASPEREPGHHNVVGQDGMPTPAAKPKGPKLKFTPEDDGLLVELKETKSLTWKQIADFFPGRSSGTLQVRYCTKLKAKTSNWTDDMVQKLRTAITDYDNDRWRAISGRVGNGFSAAACREKALELEEEAAAYEAEAQGDDDE